MAQRQGIMLCYPFEEKRLAKWEPPYIVQPKLDGERCRALKVNNQWVLLSSTLNLIESCPHILDYFNQNVEWGEWDGELYCHGMNFNDISSIVSRTVNLHPDHSNIQFHIFDCVNNLSQAARIPLAERHLPKDDRIRIVPCKVCWDLTDVMRAYDLYLEDGYEGIIIRHFEGLYVRKRSTSMMKFKPKKDDYYRIIGWKQMKDKYGVPKPMLGALVCQGDDLTTFDVGSGMTDDFRTTHWPDPNYLIGQLCHVQYQHLTPDHAPRFPVFLEVVEPEPIIKF